MATTIVLVRHGETDWNLEGRFQGHADTSLNATGRTGARRLAAELASEPVAALYSSPLARALETARIVGGMLDLDVRVESSLSEIDVGSWQGLTRTEIEAGHPAGYRRWLDGAAGWEHGESYEALAARVVPALVGIGRVHDGRVVVAVTHGGPIRAALRAARGPDARLGGGSIGNCAHVRIAIRDGEIEAVD